MEASEEILLNSLSNSGVPIPAGISSVAELTPVTLIAICSHSLLLIDGPHNAASFRTSSPDDSLPDRVKICTDLAVAFNNLGFNPSLSFHNFLYPSKDDLYKLVRFLVRKLPDSSGTRIAAFGDSVQNEGILNIFKSPSELNSEFQVQDSCRARARHSYSSEGVESFGNNGFRDQLLLLKESAEMVLNGQHSVESYIEELNEQVETKRNKLKELEFEWDAIEQSLQDKKSKLEQLMLIELQTESVSAQIERRVEELSKLSLDVEKQPKLGRRRSYIERINEITKNSRKQDNDVQRILKDTRELQLESNTIQERLNRTYAIVDETIFREAKKDHVARQAYGLLTKIHESFEQVAEKILAADRSRRDAADLEAKLGNVLVRSFDMAKLQEDLDAIRKENELLEQQLS
ncbi:hypothetical protein CASFOL_019887 [Castilleja foliolosa]|uniref:Coiled-coil domain-containing protein 22 homolog n=1 Tax=Castilleja foliolosa TaxID=1961234 RepID=A0ABD3CZA1_9LAMI